MTWTLAGLFVASLIGGAAWLQARHDAHEAARFPTGTYPYLDGETGQLFHTAAVHVARSPAPPSTRVGHRIRISRDAARLATERGMVPVVLPDGTHFEVRYEREEFASTGDWTFVGRVRTPFGELASVLTFGPDGVFGTLPAPDGRLFQVTTSHGTSTIAAAGGMLPEGVAATDPGATDYLVPGAPTPAASSAMARAMPMREPRVREAAAEPVRSAAAPVTVDVLGLFATNLATLRGSESAARTEFANLLAIANQAHIDSGTNVRLRLVELLQTDYPGDLGNRTALSDLTYDTLPDGLALAPLRDATAADLVVMLRPHLQGDSSCGIAWLNGAFLAPENADAQWAASVSNVAPCGPYVLAHETGHSMGSTHDIETASDASGNVRDMGAYPYSFGYRQNGPPGFATVMAYATGMPWIGRYSDPVATACEGPCGNSAANNALSLRQMAPRVAAFGHPPGTLSIDDSAVLESDGYETMQFRVRLAGPAGPGGVRFSVTASNGSAVAGEDYVGGIPDQVIPEGSREVTLPLSILGDRDVEEDETVHVSLHDVSGATLHDGEATGVIRNDDPRVVVHGRLRFPADAPPGDGAMFQLSLFAQDGEILVDSATVAPPDYAYGFRAVPSDDMHLELFESAAYAGQVLTLGPVQADVERDIDMSPPASVSGRLLFPEGGPDAGGAIDVAIQQRGAGGSFGWLVTAEAPGYEFDVRKFHRDAEVTISVRPAPPYYPVSVDLGVIGGDVVRDILLPATPLLARIGSGDFWEGGAPSKSGTSPSVELMGPAPAGGATVRIRAVPETAAEGTDFEPFDSIVRFNEGERIAASPDVLWIIGDDVQEPDESLRLVVVEATGVRLPPGEVSSKAWIRNDDFPAPVVSDVDGDGASDLLWHSRTAERVQWWSGGVPGQGAGEQSVGPAYGIAATGDFNGNGRVDLLWESMTLPKLALWSRYDTHFEVEYLSHPGRQWRVFGSADIAGTGLATNVWVRPGLRWVVADTPWGTSHSYVYPEGHEPAAIGDLDGDGHDDLVFHDTAGGGYWRWPGNASGTFGSAVQLDPGPGTGRVFAAADLDGDGKDELFRHDAVGDVVGWWSLDGTGVGRSGTRLLPAGHRLAAIGDYDADGRTDLVWRDAHRTKLLLWKSTGNDFEEAPFGNHPGGDWAPVLPNVPESVSGAGGNGGSVHAADINGDGRADLVWHNALVGQLDWWRMDGWTRTGLLGQPVDKDLALVAIGDFNGDARDDVAWRSRTDGAVTLWRSLQDDSFEASGTAREAGANWRVVGVGDLDGNGSDDLVWRDDATRRLHWWLMGDAGDAIGSAVIPAGFRLAATADLDGNGRDDLVWHDMGGDAVYLWRLAEQGGIDEAFIASWPEGYQVLVGTGDVDADGRDDLVWRDVLAGRGTWWRMNGAVRASTGPIASLSPENRIVALADFNGDGRLDVAWHDPSVDEMGISLWTGEDAFMGMIYNPKRFAKYPRMPMARPRAVAGGADR